MGRLTIFLAGLAAACLAAAAVAAPAKTPRIVRLSDPNRVSKFAPVARTVDVHSGPTARSRVITRLSTQTPEGTTNIVLLLRRAARRDSMWIQVSLPVLPNNTVGWVRRRYLGRFYVVHTHLVVDRTRLTATLYRDGRAIFSARVGVGQPQWPTPAGQFYVRDKIISYNPFYGPVAFGTSARSAVLTDWPGGGFIGIHGTNEPQILPGHVSHGCVRMRNADILRLARLMIPGTPLTVR